MDYEDFMAMSCDDLEVMVNIIHYNIARWQARLAVCTDVWSTKFVEEYGLELAPGEQIEPREIEWPADKPLPYVPWTPEPEEEPLRAESPELTPDSPPE